MKDLKKIAKSTGTYFFGSVLSKIIVFFMLPLYTAYIPAADMGYYDSSVAVVTFFSSVLFLDIGVGILRFMFEKKQEAEQKKAIYSGLTIFVSSLSLYTIVALIGYFLLSFQYFVFIVLYGFFMSLNTVYGFITRGYGANVLYAISGIVSTVVNVGCNLIFILALGWDYKSLYLSFIISMIVHIIILEFKCKLIANFSIKHFDKELFKKMFMFALPLCLNSVAFWLLNSSNRLIVATVLGPEFNGYLAIAMRFTSILYLVAKCFDLAWQELAFSKENKLNQATGNYYSKAFDLYLRVLMVGLLLLIPSINLWLTIYPKFIDQSYADSIILIPLALTGTIMAIASKFLGSIFGAIKKTKVSFISTLAGAIVNLVVIFSLLNVLGVMAANIAFIAGFTTAVLVRTIVLRKEIGLKVNYWYFAIFVPLLAIIIIIFNNLGWYYNLLAIVIVGTLGVYILRNEIKEIKEKIIRRKK